MLQARTTGSDGSGRGWVGVGVGVEVGVAVGFGFSWIGPGSHLRLHRNAGREATLANGWPCSTPVPASDGEGGEKRGPCLLAPVDFESNGESAEKHHRRSASPHFPAACSRPLSETRSRPCKAVQGQQLRRLAVVLGLESAGPAFPHAASICTVV